MISWLEKNNKLSWIITILIAILIFYMSSLTFQQVGGTDGISYKAKIYHITAFFFFALSLSISLIKGKYKKLIPFVIIVSIIYGISDEVHQLFVPSRHFSIQDILFDSIGILFASIIYLISIEYRNNH